MSSVVSTGKNFAQPAIDAFNKNKVASLCATIKPPTNVKNAYPYSNTGLKKKPSCMSLTGLVNITYNGSMIRVPPIGDPLETLEDVGKFVKDLTAFSSFANYSSSKTWCSKSSYSDDSIELSFTDTPILDESIVKRGDIEDNLAIIDYLSFSFKPHDFYAAFPDSKAISTEGDDLILEISKHLENILGYGVTVNHGHGRFNYTKSYMLGNNAGLFCIGGSNGNIFISLTGQGLMQAYEGFEYPLHDFLAALNTKVTRIDVAHDIYDGSYTVDKCRQDYIDGNFDPVRGVAPSGEARGDWDKVNGKGRTFYVGSRKSGKLLRVYEKGLQLGGAFSTLYKDWVRIEVEFKSHNRVIPLDVLINPAQYLAGSYPALDFISEKQTRIKTIRHTVEVSYDSAVKYAKKQFGKLLYLVKEVEGDNFLEFIEKNLVGDDYPDRFKSIIPDLEPSFPAFEPSPTFNDFSFNEADKIDSFNGLFEYMVGDSIFVRGLLGVLKFDVSNLVEADFNSFLNLGVGDEVSFYIGDGYALSGRLP